MINKTTQRQTYKKNKKTYKNIQKIQKKHKKKQYEKKICFLTYHVFLV